MSVKGVGVYEGVLKGIGGRECTRKKCIYLTYVELTV